MESSAELMLEKEGELVEMDELETFVELIGFAAPLLPLIEDGGDDGIEKAGLVKSATLTAVRSG